MKNWYRELYLSKFVIDLIKSLINYYSFQKEKEKLLGMEFNVNHKNWKEE